MGDVFEERSSKGGIHTPLVLVPLAFVGFSGLFCVNLLMPVVRGKSFRWPVPSTGATY